MDLRPERKHKRSEFDYFELLKGFPPQRICATAAVDLFLLFLFFLFCPQRHGYCTLGEALNRLDFSSAIQDLRRFNYVAKVRLGGGGSGGTLDPWSLRSCGLMLFFFCLSPRPCVSASFSSS